MLLPVWFASLETPGVSGTWELGALPPGPGQPACSWWARGGVRLETGGRLPAGHRLGPSSLPSTQLPAFRQHRGWGRADSAQAHPAPELSAHGLGLVSSWRERGSLGVGRAVFSPTPKRTSVPRDPQLRASLQEASACRPRGEGWHSAATGGRIPRGAAVLGQGTGAGLCPRTWPWDSEGRGQCSL